MFWLLVWVRTTSVAWVIVSRAPRAPVRITALPAGGSATTLGFLGAAVKSSRMQAAGDGFEPENATELQVLRDQHRALKIAHHTLATEMAALRLRCDQCEVAMHESMANATRLAHALARSERLRSRAATEANELRARARDSLARIAELEARVAAPKTNNTHAPSERALRIHIKRRARLANTTTVDDAPPKQTHEPLVEVEDPPAIDFHRPVPRHQKPQHPERVVLVPEYGIRRHVGIAPPPEAESLASKLGRGSTIYQQLQVEVARRRLGRTPDLVASAPLDESFFSALPQKTIDMAAAAAAAAKKPDAPHSATRRKPATPVSPPPQETIVQKLRRGSPIYQQLVQDMVRERMPPPPPPPRRPPPYSS